MSTLKVAMNPWDFTLYKCDDSVYIMKVIFSEGDYKIDVERFFILTDYVSGIECNTQELIKISQKIRDNYNLYKDREISKSDFNMR
ncbi:hypothetical protein [Pantoea ananatis]